MISTFDQPRPVQRRGFPAPYVRGFGWVVLSVLAAFLINNILIVWYDFPGVMALAGESSSAGALIQAAIYGAAIALAVVYVMATPDQALRWDARRISDFNAWIVRGAFFAVLLVGVVDALIAFGRVEHLLEDFFSPEMVKNLTRANFLGPMVHMPLVILGFVIALFSRVLGFPWLALLIVVAELLIVLSRFVFSYEQALMGDLVRYWYAALFLFASAYTLLEEGHVRVDIFYAGMRGTTRGAVNAIGSCLLGMTTAGVILWVGLGSPRAIINSPLKNIEISQAGVSGMYIKYHMAAFLAIFAITMLIQFVSYFFEAIADMRREPGHVEHDEIIQ